MSNTIINNAGKYNRQITIYQETITKDPDGFPALLIIVFDMAVIPTEVN